MSHESHEVARPEPDVPESSSSGPWWVRPGSKPDAGDPWRAPAAANNSQSAANNERVANNDCVANNSQWQGWTEVTSDQSSTHGDPFAPPPPTGYSLPDTLGGSHRPRRIGTGPLVAAVVAGALVAGTLGGAGGYYLAERHDRQTVTDPNASLGSTPAGTTTRAPDSVAGIAAAVLPAVVSIEVTSSGEGGTGSGFVIRQDGYILTNNHVTEAAGSNGKISVSFNDHSRAPAQIVGRSATYDLAVVKVERTGLAVAKLGNSDAVLVGDPVVAIGSPLGLQGTVTSGIVSAKDRPVTAGAADNSDRSYISALQTDAAINPGNSGGPLVDASGQVIGVNSAIATLSQGLTSQSGSIGLGFSIPINQARRTAEQIIREGKATYPVIGASLDPTFSGDGVRIAAQDGRSRPGVTPDGPSDHAGLKSGDVITKVDGVPISTPEELIVAIRKKAPGDKIQVTYQRAGSERTATITLGGAEG